MIEVQNLVKMYGKHKAVDHLNFTIEKGKIYGFLGPNGAGKSTTMNIMTGYLGATEGKVLVNGHDILKEPELAKKCIGYLPEQPPLYMEMTVTEYLQFAAELKKIPKKDIAGQLKAVMGLTKLSGVEHRLIQNLSKGYRQRVGFAQALLGFPEIIILDEPTVGLDPKQIIEIRELIRKLAETHTVILSSHILSEVSAVCDRILIINKGKLVACDTPENLEKMARGSNTLEISVKGEEEHVREVLNQMEEIRQLQWQEDPEQGFVTVKITTDENKDIREKIFYKMAEQRLPIMDMHFTKVSLEDVFLELTSDQENTDAEKKSRDLEENIINEKKSHKTEDIMESQEPEESEKQEETEHGGDL